MQYQYAALLGARVITGLINVVLLILVARTSGVSVYGALGVAIAILGYVALVSDFGMTTFISRERARGNAGDVASALRLNAVTSCLMAAGSVTTCALLAVFTPVPWYFALLALGAALEKNTDAALSVSVADRRVWTVPISLVLRRTLSLAGFFVIVSVPSISSVAAYCLAMLVAALAGQVHVRIDLRAHTVRPDSRPPWPQVIRRLWPFALASLSSAVQSLDSVAAGAMCGAYQTGLYSAAMRLVSPFWLLSNSMRQILVPHSARKSASQAMRLAKQVTVFHLVLLCACAFVALFSQSLTLLLLGTAYQESAGVLAIGLIAFPVIALSSTLGSVLQGQNDSRFVAVNGVAFALALLIAMPTGAALGAGQGLAAATGLVFLAKDISLWARIRRLVPDHPQAQPNEQTDHPIARTSGSANHSNGPHFTYSIIVPTHNSGSYVERLIASIPRRSDIELIVIDDHSEPDQFAMTRQILEHSGIAHWRLLPNNRGRGAGGARNLGVSEAGGDWLIFADSDDAFAPTFQDALERYATAETDLVLFRPAPEPTETGVTRTAGYETIFDRGDIQEIGYRFPGVVWKWFRRSLVIDHGLVFSETMLSNDYLFSVTAFAYAQRPVIDNVAVYYASSRTGSLSYHKHSIDELLVRVRVQIEVADFLRSRLRGSTLRKVLPAKGSYLKAALRIAGVRGFLRLFGAYFGHGLPFRHEMGPMAIIRVFSRIRQGSDLMGTPGGGRNA
ncbi:MAG: glycosyltransferase [Bifidobacteriaceae bacterium]|jgi:O-antigen/teichoic acid export membrane protein/glycosyltransferase involved in cell wall biosynthesis|nr:glycosyltransferase [Bifidobacteriaceae bacterium]